MAIYKCRYVKQGSTDIAGACYISYGVRNRSAIRTGGVGTPGQAGKMVKWRDVTVTLYGSNLAASLALIGVAKSNVVAGYTGNAGTNQKITFKNVRWTEPLGAKEIKARDAGGKVSLLGVRGHCCWLKTDTLALMIVRAADA